MCSQKLYTLVIFYALYILGLTNDDNFITLKATIPFDAYVDFVAVYHNSQIINVNGMANGKSLNNVTYSNNLSNASIYKSSSIAWHTKNISSSLPLNTGLIQFSGQSYAMYGDYVYGVAWCWNYITQNGTYDTLFMFNLSSFEYINLTKYNSKMVSETNSPCVVASESHNKIFVIGLDLSDTNGAVQVYDIINDKWSSYPINIGITRQSAGCSMYNDSIYIFGGWAGNGENVVGSIQRYDIFNKSWSIVASHLSIARHAFECITFDVLIYCVGGQDADHNYLDSVEIFNVSEQKIITSTLRLNVARAQHRIIRYKNDYMIVYGGYSANWDWDEANTIEMWPSYNGVPKSNETMVIIMIVISVLLVLILIIIVIWYYQRRRRNPAALLEAHYPRIM